MSLEHLKRPSDDIPDRYQINRNNSPLTNKNSVFDPRQINQYTTTIDNSKIITIGTRNQSNIDLSTGQSYFPKDSSNISADYKPIVGSEVGRDYQNRIYGINAYKGSNKDDEIGGIFNSPLDKYSNTFRIINTPTINEIVDSGNTTTRGGYPTKKVAVDLVQSMYDVSPTRYYENGRINISGTDFNKRGTSIEGIPIVNPINASGLQFRTRDVDVSNLFPNVLGEGELKESKLATQYKSLLHPRRSEGVSVGDEPYITFDTNGISNEVNIGQSGGRGIPINSLRLDSHRIGQWMNNNALSWVGKRTLLTGQSLVVGNEYSIFGEPIKTKKFSQKFEGVVNDLALPATMLLSGVTGGTAISERGYDIPGIHVLNQGLLARNPKAITLGASGFKYEQKARAIPRAKSVSESFLPKPTALTNFFANLLDSPRDQYDAGGDPITNAGVTRTILPTGGFSDPLFIIDRESDVDATVQERALSTKGLRKLVFDKINDENYNIPFYFKDLRNDTVIIFRAYITGLTENIKPSWNSSTFIGRSEPVYNYTHGERDINFNLKLFAGTRKELDRIYTKLNRLTSLAYPEYKQDLNLNNKIRMKPPLTKFRYGDMYNADKTAAGEYFTGLLGFISSITYSIPDNAVYEIDKGAKVPKYIEAAISYTVIHNEAPSSTTNFYGYAPK